MAIMAIENEADFLLRISHRKGVSVVYFWAPWCEPCKLIRDEIKRAEQYFDGKVAMFKVDIDQLRSLADKYEIMAVPTLLFFKNGQPVKRIIGYVAQKEIEMTLKQMMAE